jgi:hypothetical protein
MVNNIARNEDAFNKDIEIQSVRSSSTDIEDVEIREEKIGQEVWTEDDIEHYPEFVEAQDEAQRRQDGTVARAITQNSWKDPGPPPDGGREAWIQGSFPLPLF